MLGKHLWQGLMLMCKVELVDMCEVRSGKRHASVRGRSTRCRARLAACLLLENHHFLIPAERTLIIWLSLIY